MKSFREYLKEKEELQELNEASLSRLWRHNDNYDCAVVSVFRGNLTKKENLTRHSDTMFKLKAKNLNRINVRGVYPEGGKKVKELGIFVVDAQGVGLKELERVVFKLGKEYNQDSVLILPKGSMQGEARGYLLGTADKTDERDAFPGKIGKKHYFKQAKMSYADPNYTTYVNGRPFSLVESSDKYATIDGMSNYGVRQYRDY